MLFKALKTNHTYQAGKEYDLDETSNRTKQYVRAGILEPIKKPKAAARKKKVVKPSETK